MNRLIQCLCVALLALAAAAVPVSCSKASHNGDLDGQWQVMQVVSGGEDVVFPEGEIYYYNFYLHTFQLSYTGKRSIRMTGNMAYDEADGRLALELGFVKAGRVSKELLDRLPYWGFSASGEDVMRIEELTSSRLVMRHDDVTIVCRKF